MMFRGNCSRGISALTSIQGCVLVSVQLMPISTFFSTPSCGMDAKYCDVCVSVCLSVCLFYLFIRMHSISGTRVRT